MLTNSKRSKWASQLFIGSVLVINIQSAIIFFLFPENFLQNFGLPYISGIPYIQGVAVLFLMWNVPYFFAALNPIKNRLSLIEAIIMQTIGIIGETYILYSLKDQISSVAQLISRFIIFDIGGLVLLLIAFWITHKQKKPYLHKIG